MGSVSVCMHVQAISADVMIGFSSLICDWGEFPLVQNQSQQQMNHFTMFTMSILHIQQWRIRLATLDLNKYTTYNYTSPDFMFVLR